jgi:hypothetical protein
VRRTRLVGAQAELFPNWRYHAFVTDRVGTRSGWTFELALARLRRVAYAI